MHSIRYHASANEIINITISTPLEREEIEYDSLLRDVNRLLDNTVLVDLQENESFQDITYLSNELEVSALKVEHLVMANRMMNAYEIDAAFWYALFQKNTLQKNDFTRPYGGAFYIDLNTDLELIIYNAALAEADDIRTDVQECDLEKIVSRTVNANVDEYIEILQDYISPAEAYYTIVYPALVIENLNDFIREGNLAELKTLFVNNENDLNALFRSSSKKGLFKSKAKAQQAEVILGISQVVGTDKEIIEQVKQIRKIKKPEEVQQLAALHPKEWKAILEKSQKKLKVKGKALNKNLLDRYALNIAQKLEKQHPTIAFSAQLNRTPKKKQVLRSHQPLNEFLIKYADFDLQKTQIEPFLKKKRIVKKIELHVREELKSVQRIFKLVPQFKKTISLLRTGVHSAQSIVALGESRFIEEVAPKANIAKKEAQQIFEKAQTNHTASLLILGELQDTISVMNIPATEINSLSAQVQQLSQDFPNLKSLFKMTDVCACQHCRSVYSPSAYFVELLQFLENRSAIDLTNNNNSSNAKDVLFNRRPDLERLI